jgi:hypothetical protein
MVVVGRDKHVELEWRGPSEKQGVQVGQASAPLSPSQVSPHAEGATD